MLATSLTTVLPVFFVIAIGVILGRTFALDVVTLNKAALYGAVPALVLSSLSSTALTTSHVGRLLGGQAAVLLATGSVAYLVSRFLKPPVRRNFVATSLFSNSANMMLPVAFFAFGQSGLERALVLFVFSTLVLYVLGPAVLSDVSVWRPQAYRKVLQLPVFWAAFLGTLLNMFKVEFPTVFSRSIELLSGAAIPLVLLTLGLQMSKSQVASFTSDNWFAASFKLVGGPIIGFSVGWGLNLRGLDLAVLTLLAAMPPAVNVFMLALDVGSDAANVARTVTLATLLSLPSLALIVWLLK